MSYPPSQKPPIWSIDPGVIAYNCQKAGMPHPVLAMPMWEGGGSLARDYSGHGNHGAFINSPMWAADRIDFNGTNNYLDLPDDIIPTSTISSNGLTWLIEIQPDEIDLQALVGQAPTYYDYYSSGGLYISTNNKAQMTLYKNGYNHLEGTTTLSTNENYQIIGTYNPSDDVTKIYVNGDLENTSNVLGGSFLSGVNIHATIAVNPRYFKDPPAAPYWYDGKVKQVIAFDLPLTNVQVKFISANPYFMYQIPEELYGYVAAAPPTGNPFWYYNMLRRRN